ncbi:hypothetical protein, partial [Poseidonibacter lekithochrous]
SGIELSDCTKALNQTVYLDANLGVLAVDATPQVAQYFHRAIKLAQTQQEKQNGFAQQKATTQDGHCIEVAANIACSIEA